MSPCSPNLYGLVKPAVSTVPATAPAMQHLHSCPTPVHLVRDAWHGRIQAHGEDALLNGTYRLLIGPVWRGHIYKVNFTGI